MSRTLILGAAVSGLAAMRLAQRLGHEVTVYDRHEPAVADLDESVAAVGGKWDRRLLAEIDLVVTSPGIPQGAAPIVDSLAADVDFVSEMEFGFRNLDARCVAITGTNGKTTVTTATADILTASGVDAVAAGNIGLALSDVAGSDHDVVVVEASSFQLQFIDTFHPQAAAILNVAPDHLDWHGSSEAYTAAKRRIGERQEAADIMVYDVDDEGAVAAVVDLPATLVPISGHRRPAGGNGPVGQDLFVGEAKLRRPSLDAAFTMDLTAAATLAARMGASADAMDRVIEGFTPVEHRRTVVGEWGGVSWINDSKATNPHAAVAAARAYPSVVLIAGGRNKGLDLGPLARVETVRAVIGLGEAGGELAAATPAERFHSAESLEHAIELADELAGPGDTVLLAPGCASFDMFHDYNERGRIFTDLVTRRKSD
ncbi:MAG: UDP-N-acetylmuramoyl-L-alanine--D-glutamate ligase [bacterium]|nr:UDP-N-acetylmuramoyl-L-alanine--D-glutamate ligase [bacterium]